MCSKENELKTTYAETFWKNVFYFFFSGNNILFLFLLEHRQLDIFYLRELLII